MEKCRKNDAAGNLTFLWAAYTSGPTSGNIYLRRFAAETVGAARTVGDDGLMLLDFASEQAKQRRVSLESKGYINRGWQISERRAVR